MKEILLSDIKSSSTNPRVDLGTIEELAESIKQHGVIQPIIVKKIEDGYELVIGTRRFEASKLAGKKTIPAIIEDITNQHAMILGLLENIQRKDLEWFEEAIIYVKLNKELTQEEISDRISKPRQTIQHFLYAYEVLEHVPIAKELPLDLVSTIKSSPKEDWEMLVEKSITDKLTREDLRNIISSKEQSISKNIEDAGRLVTLIENMKEKDKSLANELYEIYYKKRFCKGALKLIELEIAIRTGQIKAGYSWFNSNDYTKEQVEEIAKSHYGELVGEETIKAWKVYMVPKNVKEIREELEKV